MGGTGSSKVTVGYKYYAGLHMVVCEGPAAVWAIKIGDKTVYQNIPIYLGIPPVNLGPTRYHLNKPDLFGGEDREGGVVGYIDILPGKDNQGQNDYLLSKLGSDVPAFRGVLSVVARQCYLSAMNPYIKPWHFMVTRIPDYAPWSSPDLTVVGANPVSILLELIYENNLGEADFYNFRSAGQYYEDEKFKLCIAWNGESLESFMQTILDHMGAILFVNPVTGKFQLTIPEDPTSYKTHTIYEKDIQKVTSFQRTSLAETINQITVTYVDFWTGDERSVTVQDIANINAQGKVVADERKYPGIPTHELAVRVATRDLQVASSSLSKISLIVKRPTDDKIILPGDVIKIYWPKLGIDGVSFRVGEVDYGEFTSPTIKIEAVEDIYSLKPSSYVNRQNPLWEDPVPDPVNVTHKVVTELPYWEIVMNSDPESLEAMPKNEGLGFLGTLARAPVSYNFGYRVYVDGNEFTKAEFCPTCIIDEDIGFLDDEVVIANATQLELAEFGDDKYAILGDEIIGTESISGNKIRIKRGCLDTVAKPHAAGEVIYFASGWFGTERREFIDGERVNVKLCTITGKGELPLSQAESINVEFKARIDRPYPPSYPEINGIAYPKGASFEGNPELNITWRHRNRLLQTAYIVDHTEGNITPEEGTTYSVEIKQVLNQEVLFRQDGIEGTSIVVPPLNVDGELLVSIWSVRDGFDSWQKQEFVIYYYQETFPGRITENGEVRITENDEERFIEDFVEEDVLYRRVDEMGEQRYTEDGVERRVESDVRIDDILKRITEDGSDRITEKGTIRIIGGQ